MLFRVIPEKHLGKHVFAFFHVVIKLETNVTFFLSKLLEKGKGWKQTVNCKWFLWLPTYYYLLWKTAFIWNTDCSVEEISFEKITPTNVIKKLEDKSSKNIFTKK